jgi:putative tributyrin esterase
MPWRQVTGVPVPSAALGRDLPVSLLLPPDYESNDDRYAVVYALHGKGGNERQFFDRLYLPRFVDRQRMIFVMPGATRTFYVDSSAGAYETAIVDDLVPWVDANYRTRPDAGARGVAGQSMGGYGALFLSLRHPAVFGAAYAIEPALVWGQRPLAEWKAEVADVDHLLPADPCARSEWDLFAQVARAPRQVLDGLRWQISEGNDDYFLEISRAFHHYLTQWRVPHGYSEHPGAHTFEFGNDRLPDMLDWFARQFGATPPSPVPPAASSSRPATQAP